MRSVLVDLGPWAWWTFPILWGCIFLFVGAWQAVENRQTGQRFTRADWLGAAGVSLITAALLFYLVNRFAPLSIKAYGAMMLVAFVTGSTYMVISRREGDLDLNGIIDVALGALVGGIVGSQIIYIALNWHDFSDFRTMADLWSGGLSFHGGVAGAAIVVYIYCRRKGINFCPVADQMAPALAIGYGFARIGCFLNGCCHGGPANLPWAVTFPDTGACSIPGVPVHPTQLYASLLSFLIAFILVKIRPHIKVYGHLFISYLMIYSVMRFSVEFTRAGFTGQFVSTGLWMTETACKHHNLCNRGADHAAHLQNGHPYH